MKPKYPTKNDLSIKTRTEIIGILQPRLADSIDLWLQCKQAHWNVKGPNFIALHELFDTIAELMETYVDEVAERIVQLGGVAEGTVRKTTKGTSLKEYPDVVTGLEHCEALSTAMADFDKKVRDAIDKADEAGDAVTADLLTEISRGLDVKLWFVEAHLQG